MMNTLIVIISCICMARALPHPEKTMRVEKTKRDAGEIGLHHYNVHAHEMGTLVEEKVDVDEERGLVSYSIPQHNDIDESVFVYDFKNNLTLMIFAQAGKCYVAPLDDRESQDPKTTVAAFQSTGEQEKAVSGIETDSYVIDGGEVEADAVLPPDLVERCSGMSVSRVKPMLETFSFDSDDEKPSLRKRTISEDNCYICLKEKCVVGNNHCQYVVMCGTVVNDNGEREPDCRKQQRVHKFSNVYRCNTCCDLNHMVRIPGMGRFRCGDSIMDGATSGYPTCTAK